MSMAMSIRDRLRNAQGWSLGLIFLSLVVALWVLSSFLLNAIFEKDVYSKPILITWINTSSFAFFLVPYYWDKRRKTPTVLEPEDDESETLIQTDKLKALTFKQTIKLSFWFCLLWFTSNLLNNASLIFTSVSSQTILASTSSLFTIVIGATVGLETLNKVKLICIAMSMVGVTLVTTNDNPEVSTTSPTVMWGNILALAGALCYGVYSILLKLEVKQDWRIDMRLFFGFVGVFNTLILWPPLVVMHVTGYETIEAPPFAYVYWIIIFNCAASFLADFLWARAMLLTSPVTVTVGLSMTIPVAMTCDFLFKFKRSSPVYVLGALLICISFYLVNRSEQEDHGEENETPEAAQS